MLIFLRLFRQIRLSLWALLLNLSKTISLSKKILFLTFSLSFFIAAFLPSQAILAVEASPPVALEVSIFRPGGISGLLPVGSAIVPDSLSTEPVYLDGRRIFSVAAVDGVSAGARSRLITLRLQSIAQGLGSSPVVVTWETDSESQLPILSVGNKVLMTVTEADAKALDFSQPPLLAESWKADLEQALRNSQQERTVEHLKAQSAKALGIMTIMIMVSFGLRRVQSRLNRQAQKSPGHNLDFAQELPSLSKKDLLRYVSQHQARSLWALQKCCCHLGRAIVWWGGGLLLLSLFPYSRQWRPSLLELVGLPLKIGVIWLVIYSLIRFGHVLVERLFVVVQNKNIPKKRKSQRLTLRFSTISRVSKNVIATLLIVVGSLATLSLIGINLGPLLAGAGIVGLALSFASQSILKDVINGFLILLEDHFGVGDVIIAGDKAGFVENMNLRITQLRNEEGRLITIPNSQISTVENLSKEWSRVDISIPVALDADIDRAMALIHSVAKTMYASPEWSEAMLEPPELLGVDHLDHAGATVRIWIMTQPLKQWEVAREYRRRLKRAFDESEITMGAPQQVLHVQPHRLRFKAALN